MIEIPRRFGPVAVALAFMALAALLMGETFRDEYHQSRAGYAMGPAFYPRIVLALIMAMAVLVVVDAFRGEGGRVRLDGLGRVLGLVGITIAYGIGIGILGFAISSIVFVIATALVLGYRRLEIVVPVAVAYAFGVWALFQKVLLIILPSSPWFSF